MDTVHRRQALLPLTLGAVGVVYGDIGTSPLYGFKQAADAAGTISPATIVMRAEAACSFFGGHPFLRGENSSAFCAASTPPVLFAGEHGACFVKPENRHSGVGVAARSASPILGFFAQRPEKV